jgi:hypothetical protein
MKLASYIARGKPAFGQVTEGGIVTLSDRMGERNITQGRARRGRLTG